MRQLRWWDHLPMYFFPSWWRYVLDDSRCDPDYGPTTCYFERLYNPLTGDSLINPIGYARNWIARFWCRWRGHPCGMIWQNTGSLEPNTHCKDCGEDIG